MPVGKAWVRQSGSMRARWRPIPQLLVGRGPRLTKRVSNTKPADALSYGANRARLRTASVHHADQICSRDAAGHHEHRSHAALLVQLVSQLDSVGIAEICRCGCRPKHYLMSVVMEPRSSCSASASW